MMMTPLCGIAVSVLNTRVRGCTKQSLLTPARSSRLIRDHYVKLLHRLSLADSIPLPAVF